MQCRLGEPTYPDTIRQTVLGCVVALACDDVWFEFPGGGHRPVLRGVSAVFEPGALTAVVGPNGAGKSTLLRLLLGVIEPTGGACTLDGVATGSMSAGARAARVAYIGQRPAVSGFGVREVVAMGRHAVGRDDAAVERAMEAAGVADLAARPVNELSAGQLQRVSLARALAQLAGGGERGGGVLLADEPAAALDPRHAVEALTVLRGLARGGGMAGQQGVAAVVVLHDLHLASRFADRALVLRADGTVAACDAADRALAPETLREVFGIGFERVATGSGRALMPVV